MVILPINRIIVLSPLYQPLINDKYLVYKRQSILFPYQFVYRTNHSTAQAIFETTNNLMKAIDQNLYTCGVPLDFSKAFDTVNHQILLNRLEVYGIRGIPMEWFILQEDSNMLR